MFKVALLTLAASTSLTAVAASSFLASPPVSPQSLVGPWEGTSGAYTGPMNPPPPSGATQALVVFDGEPAMYQFLPTVPGQMYEVSFNMRLPDLSGGVPVIGESTVGPAEFDINLNGASSSYLVQNRTSWAYYQFDFIATGTSTELWQQVPQYISRRFGLFQLSEAVLIDNESFYPVPEPSLPALALIGWALRFRRRFAVRQSISD